MSPKSKWCFTTCFGCGVLSQQWKSNLDSTLSIWGRGGRHEDSVGAVGFPPGRCTLGSSKQRACLLFLVDGGFFFFTWKMLASNEPPWVTSSHQDTGTSSTLKLFPALRLKHLSFTRQAAQGLSLLRTFSSLFAPRRRQEQLWSCLSLFVLQQAYMSARWPVSTVYPGWQKLCFLVKW